MAGVALAVQLMQPVALAQTAPVSDPSGPNKPAAESQVQLAEPRPVAVGAALGNASVPADVKAPSALHQMAQDVVVDQGQKRAPATEAPPSDLPASGTVVIRPGASLEGKASASGSAAPSSAAPLSVEDMRAHGYIGVPVGSAAVAPAAPVPQVASILNSVQVNQNLNCGFGTNEASVAQANDNPNNVVVGAQMYLQANGTCTGDSRPWAFYSHDGGQHFKQTVVSSSFAGGGDTAVVFDPKNHRFIETFIEFTRDGAGNAICPNRVGARASGDGGASWALDTTFQACPGNGGFLDKEMITVDQNPSSPHYGRVAIVWTQFGGGACAPNPFCLWNVFSDNGGTSWTFGATSINQPGISTCGNGSSPAFDANGELLVVWFNCTGTKSIRSELSTDGGATWPDIDRTVTNINDIGNAASGNCLMNLGGTAFRCNSFPALAGDPNPNDVGGRAFQVVWADADSGSPGGGQVISQIKGLGTENAGGTWNGGGASCPPTCFGFNYMSNANSGDKFFPWISFSPSGRLNVGYSSREDNATVGNPHGTSFNEHGTEAASFFALRRQTAYGTYTIDGTLGNPGSTTFIGDYAGITSQDNNFDTFPVWTDLRSGINVRTADLCFFDCYTFLAPYSPLGIFHTGGSSFTDLFQFNTDPNFGGSGFNYWNAVAIREGTGSNGVDDDMTLFDNRYYNVADAGSAFSPPFNDYTVENDNSGHGPSKPYFPSVRSFSSLGGTYQVEWAAGHITLGTATSDGVSASNVTRVYDAFLNTGSTYFLGLRPGAGNTANMSMALHSASRGNQQGRPQAVADTGNLVAGQPGFITYATGAEPTQFDGVVVLNNTGGAGSYTLYVDTAHPTGTLNINSGAAFTNNRNVTLNLTASNPTAGDPVIDMAFSNDGVTFAAFQPFAASAAYLLPAGEGNKTVYVEFRNGAGAISTAVISHTIFVDTVAPDVTGQKSPAANANGWNNTTTTVSWICTDPAPSSGIAFCSGPTTLSSEGANQPVVGTGTDNAGNTTNTTVFVSIDETPPSSSASLSPTPDPDGTTHANTTVTISGTDALSGMQSITMTGVGAQPFGPTTVNGNTASVTITANGETDITFHATDRAGNDETNKTVAVIITRSQASFDRGSVEFGNVVVGTTSAPQTVTLTDTGNLDLNIISIAPNNVDYTETDNCGSKVAAGASCQITLTLSPKATGPDNGTLVVTDDAADSPQSIALTGTGTAPAVTLSRTSVDFGTVPAGTSSAVQNVTLTNSGTAPLNIFSIGTDNPDFTESDNCPVSPSTLAPTAQCTLALSVTPSTDVGEGANAIINSDAPDTPETIRMTVNGGTAPLAPTHTQAVPTQRTPPAVVQRTPGPRTPTPRP